MGVWHRLVLRHAGIRVSGATDAGISIVEILVAIIILSTGLIGLAGVLISSIKQQKVENTQVTANHLADSWFAYEESLTRPTGLPIEGTIGSSTAATTANSYYQTIINQPANPTPVVDGVTYTELWSPLICPKSAYTSSFQLNTSTCSGAGTPGPSDTVFGTFKITWSVGKTAHKLSVTRNLADNQTYVPDATGANGTNPIANCTRVYPSTGTVTSTLGSIPATSGTYTNDGATHQPTANPGRIDLNSSNNPATYTDNQTGTTAVNVLSGGSWVQFTLSETGLLNATTTTPGYGSPSCIPLVWTDTNGLHQVDMHLTASSCAVGNSCNYTADVPLTQITATTPTAPTWDTELNFYALFDGTLPPNATGCPGGANCSAHNAVYAFKMDSLPTLGTCSATGFGLLPVGIQPGTNGSTSTFTGSGTNMAGAQTAGTNLGTTVTMFYTQTSGAQASFPLITNADTTSWGTPNGAGAVSFSKNQNKGTVSPAFPNPGGTTIVFIFTPKTTTDAITYVATRNDGKQATCTAKDNLGNSVITIYGSP